MPFLGINDPVGPDFRVVVWTRPDGGVSVGIPTTWLLRRAGWAGITAMFKARAERWGGRHIMVCHPSELPGRRFRNAWRQGDNGGPVTVDLPAARNIRMGEIENRVNHELSIVDREYLRALMDDDTAKAVTLVERRKALIGVVTEAEEALKDCVDEHEIAAYEPRWP